MTRHENSRQSQDETYKCFVSDIAILVLKRDVKLQLTIVTYKCRDSVKAET